MPVIGYAVVMLFGMMVGAAIKDKPAADVKPEPMLVEPWRDGMGGWIEESGRLGGPRMRQGAGR